MKRRQAKGSGGHSSSTAAYLQLVGGGSDSCPDAPPSVMLFFDAQRYVFNAAEGFQRLCVEHRVRMGRVGHYLFTRASTETLGGVPGLLLTLADLHGRGTELAAAHAQLTKISLGGPPPLRAALGTMAPYVHGRARGAAEVEEARAVRGELVETKVVDNTHVSITAFVAALADGTGGGGSSSGGSCKEATSLAPPSGAAQDDTRAATRPAKRLRTEPAAMPGGAAAATYLIELPTAPGKFDLARAEALGVPRDARRGQLVRGQAITLDNGQTIAPEQVLAPGEAGPRALIVDCPTLEHLRLLRAREGLGDRLRECVCVIHLSPLAVLETEEYQAWLREGFGDGAEQVLCAARPEGCNFPPAYGFSAAMTARLATVAPGYFTATHEGQATQSGALEGVLNAAPGRPMLRYTLRPAERRGLDASAVPALTDHAALRKEALEELCEAGVPPPVPLEQLGNAGDTQRGAEVLFLGTGSALPSKYRNVSALLVRPRQAGKGGVLLDCGEGTVTQLVRAMGVQDMRDALADLALVWISHVHADHHAGLTRMLTERRRELQRRNGPGVKVPPLAVVAPPLVRRYLEWYAALEPLSATLIPMEYTTESEAGDDEAPPPQLLDAMARAGLSELRSALVDHCQHSYGVVLRSVTHGATSEEEGEDEAGVCAGWSVAYSGDTRPTPALVRLARGVDLLIHEATFEDDLIKDAIAKRHSTTKEAVETGRDAGVKALLLTHFSQRYPKVPNFEGVNGEDGSGSGGMAVGVASDLMRVIVGGHPDAPGAAEGITATLEPLEALFRSESEDIAGADDAQA